MELIKMLEGFALGLREIGNEAAADLIAEAIKQLGELREDRDHLLKIAKKMHLWIFHNTCDEYAAYKECGLTDEDDARLGYGGQFVIKTGGNDE